MKKVLVTGSEGQLGQALFSVASAFPSLELHFFSRKELDITDYDSVHTLLSSGQWDAVLNCAAYTDVDRAEQFPKQAFLINAQAVEELAKACEREQIYLVHISTDYVFDGKKKTPYTPLDAPNPINQYGKSKWEGEKAIEKVGGTYSIVRTSWLYSEYGDNFYTKIVAKAHQNKTLFVTDKQTGTPTHAKNLANYLLLGIQNETLKKGISSRDQSLTNTKRPKKTVI